MLKIGYITIMKCWGLSFVFILTIASYVFSECLIPPSAQERVAQSLDGALSLHKARLIDPSIGDFPKNKIDYLYNLYNDLINTTRMAGTCNNSQMLEKIAELLLVAADNQVQVSNTDTRRTWKKPNIQSGTENILINSQFLHLVSAVLAYSAELYNNPNFPHLTSLHLRLGRATALGGLHSHLQRWIYDAKVFSVKGYSGCTDDGSYELVNFVPLLITRSLGPQGSLCNRLDDRYWHIAAASINLLDLNRRHPTLYPLPFKTGKLQYRDFLERLLFLHKTRISTAPFSTPDFERFLFDRGSYVKDTDGRFSEYIGPYLTPDSQEFKNLAPSPAEVSDASHHARLVQLFLTIEKSPSIQSHAKFVDWQNGKTEKLIQGLANQFASTVRTDSESGLPILANYSDGREGWYRLNEVNADGVLVRGHHPGNFTNQSFQYGYWILRAKDGALVDVYSKMTEVLNRYLKNQVSSQERRYVEMYHLRAQYPYAGPGTPTPKPPSFSDSRTLVRVYSGMAVGQPTSTPTPTNTPTPTRTPTSTPTHTPTQTPTVSTPTATPTTSVSTTCSIRLKRLSCSANKCFVRIRFSGDTQNLALYSERLSGSKFKKNVPVGLKSRIKTSVKWRRSEGLYAASSNGCRSNLIFR